MEEGYVKLTPLPKVFKYQAFSPTLEKVGGKPLEARATTRIC